MPPFSSVEDDEAAVGPRGNRADAPGRDAGLGARGTDRSAVGGEQLPRQRTAALPGGAFGPCEQDAAVAADREPRVLPALGGAGGGKRIPGGVGTRRETAEVDLAIG